MVKPLRGKMTSQRFKIYRRAFIIGNTSGIEPCSNGHDTEGKIKCGMPLCRTAHTMKTHLSFIIYSRAQNY